MDLSNKMNLLAIGVGIVIVIATIFVFYFSTKMNNEDTKDLLQSTMKEMNKKKGNSTEDHSEDDDIDYSNILNNNTADCLMGKTEKYEWSQTTDEIEVYIPLSKYGDTVNIREVDVELTAKTLKVIVRREVLIEGEFTASINEEDSIWTLDNNTKGDPHLYLMIYKITPTVKNQHWKSLLKGDKEINVNKYGPPVLGLDPNDPNAMKEAIRKVSEM